MKQLIKKADICNVSREPIFVKTEIELIFLFTELQGLFLNQQRITCKNSDFLICSHFMLVKLTLSGTHSPGTLKYDAI